MKVYIKEASLLAGLAARKMRSPNVAMVLGRTIHLWGVNRQEFLSSPRWVLHEMEHIRQFQRYGYLRFAAMYVWESLRHGYYNNKYEIEARAVEGDNKDDLRKVEFV